MKRSSLMVIFGTLFWIASTAVSALPQEDQSKGILPPEYLKKRPAIAEAMGAATVSDSGLNEASAMVTECESSHSDSY